MLNLEDESLHSNKLRLKPALITPVSKSCTGLHSNKLRLKQKA